MAFFVTKAYARITSDYILDHFSSDSGFVWEPTKFTFREMAELILSPEFTVQGDYLSTGWHKVGNTEVEESLHVACTSPYEQRAYQRLLRLKLQLCGESNEQSVQPSRGLWGFVRHIRYFGKALKLAGKL